jgi:flagellar biosynthesis anti-sigma factor FlgM
VRPARPARERTRVDSPATGSRHDRVELSASARELAAAIGATGAADADRTDLILRIRQQIAEGGYEPDAEAVARALLDRLEG